MFKAMGSPCELRLVGDDPSLLQDASRWAQDETLRFERKYSRFKEDSLVGRINARAGLSDALDLDEEAMALFGYADQCYRVSEGAFDVTSGCLRRVWFAGRKTLPPQEELQTMLKLVDWPAVEWARGEARLPVKGMEIDFGGIVKEYAADALMEGLKRRGVTSALVNLGGDIRCAGEHPDGGAWPIGVQHPFESGPIATLLLTDKAIASSGGYERYLEIEGRRYSHIIDPRTGWPVDALAAVSVVSDQAVVSGSLATIAIVLGERGLEFLSASGATWFAVDRTGKTFGTHI